MFAPDTARALEAGATFAAAALVDRAFVNEARAALGGRPRVLLTGGGATRLQYTYKESRAEWSRTSCCADGGARQVLTRG